MTTDAQTINPLRRGLLALSGLGVVGTMTELAILRHWNTASEKIPWVALVCAGAAVALMAFRPSRPTVWFATIVGLLLATAGVLGLTVHIVVNMQSAPLDGTIGPAWDSFSLLKQLWMASTGGVGPAPPLSAASLTPTGLALALVTYRHPALADRG